MCFENMGKTCRVPFKLSAPYLPSSDFEGKWSLHRREVTQDAWSETESPSLQANPPNPPPCFGIAHSANSRCKGTLCSEVYQGLIMLQWSVEMWLIWHKYHMMFYVITLEVLRFLCALRDGKDYCNPKPLIFNSIRNKLYKAVLLIL